MAPVARSKTTTGFLLLGTLTLVTGVLAGVMELLATQAPYTPLHFGILAAPYGQLRGAALGSSLLAFALGLGRSRLGRREPWVLLALLTTGSLLALGAMAVAAHGGMMAVQVFDPRPGAGALAVTRLVGQALIALAALEAARLLWRSHILQQRGDDPEAAEERDHQEGDGQTDQA